VNDIFKVLFHCIPNDEKRNRFRQHCRDQVAKARRILVIGTAIAISRGIIAVLENFQQADGTVKIPAALVPYVGLYVMHMK